MVQFKYVATRITPAGDVQAREDEAEGTPNTVNVAGLPERAAPEDDSVERI